MVDQRRRCIICLSSEVTLVFSLVYKIYIYAVQPVIINGTPRIHACVKQREAIASSDDYMADATNQAHHVCVGPLVRC